MEAPMPCDEQSGSGAPAHAAFFLVGPTASGKSAIAQHIAEKHRYGILSADSMLVYRGMDIGTAKPTAAERAGVPYFGMDLADPREPFSVGEYVKHAAHAFAEARRGGIELIVAGGTGLYIKCLTEGLDRARAADPVARARANDILEREGLEGLQKALAGADPRRYAALQDPRNPRRLIRALELAWASEPVRRSWAAKPAIPVAGLAPEPEFLRKTIRARVEMMYKQGLLDEAARLSKDCGTLSETARHAIGYEEAFAVLDGRYDVGEAMDVTARRTWQLARRQMTWFRHQANVEWVATGASVSVEAAAARVADIWKQHGRVTVHIG